MKAGWVDVVIVNLNGKHYLEKCLPSIVAHTGSIPYCFVIVDNNSQDGSIEWLRSEFPAATVIQNHHNIGFSSACNQAIRASNGEYILLLNNDTEFLNDVLAVLVEFVKSDKDAGPVGPLILFPDGSVQASIRHFPSVWKFAFQQFGVPKMLFPHSKAYYPFGLFRPGDYLELREVEWLSGACLMFSRSLYDKIGPLDEHMPFGMEDMDFARRAFQAGFKNYFVPEARILHHKGGTYKDSKSHREFVLQSYEQGIRAYFKKHHSSQEYSLIRLSMIFGGLLRQITRSLSETL